MKKFLFFLAFPVAAGIVWQGVLYVIRQKPRNIPTDLSGLTRSAEEIIRNKCAACHDSRRKPPFYAAVPLIGKTVVADIESGCRHWEPSDRRFLGASATGKERAQTPIPQALLAKLGYALDDNAMPPMKYRAVHWGTGLSPSETQIFRRWILASRAAWLSPWGIQEYAGMLIQPVPKALPQLKNKADLGRCLFKDKRLSTDSTVSCSTCHVLDKGATDNLRVSVGVGGKQGSVNAPSAFNAVFNLRQFWDGRAANLAEQAGGPPLDPVEMANKNWAEITARLEQDPGLKRAFLAVYPEGFSEKTICDAIAEYEKELLTPDSRFDRYLKGERDALTDSEKTGYAIFLSHRCDRCHMGPSMGGQSFEYVDLKDDYFEGRALTKGDRGLAAFSKNPRDMKRFKVPGLRNVALTAPYLHDGSRKTVSEAVTVMLKCQVGVPPEKREVAALDLFLQTLTGSFGGKPLAK